MRNRILVEGTDAQIEYLKFLMQNEEHDLPKIGEGAVVDTFWMVDDVMWRYECDEDTAREVMEAVLENECTKGNTWEVMDIIAQDFYDLKRKTK